MQKTAKRYGADKRYKRQDNVNAALHNDGKKQSENSYRCKFHYNPYQCIGCFGASRKEICKELPLLASHF